MARFSTKHREREQVFAFRSWHGGLNTDVQAYYIDKSELAACSNMKYVYTKDYEGNNRVALRTRTGTTKVTNTALTAAADVEACFYYKNQSQYIVATASKVYYLDGSNDPVEIGSVSAVPTFTEYRSKLIIHDGGVTNSWDGTTYRELNETHTDESLGTGDGATTEYSGTVDNPPVEPSEFDVTFTDTTEKTISDDGNGRLTGNVDAAWTGSVTNCVDNGGGLIRVTDAGHPYSTSDEINILGVTGTTEANNDSSNPTWTITKIDANTYDLQGSTFSNAFSGAGTSSKNTIIYSTGAYVFKCDGAPDNTTSITATYEETGGAPKSTGGFVRASDLYLYGDADNPSRLWHSGTNDENAWGTGTTDGGYFDVDPDDGDSLVVALNFYDIVLCFKNESIHQVVGFPGDSTFRIEPMIDGIGCIAAKTATNEGDLVAFLSTGGWMRLAATEKYGDVARADIISRTFNRNVVKYADSTAVACYNEQDNQLWLMMQESGAFQTHIHVINLTTGGQYSQYRFAFTATCFQYVNNEMLIGGADGHLYKLSNSETVYQDNSVSFKGDTYIRTAYTDWGLPGNRKVNKRIEIKCWGEFNMSGTLNLYKDYNFGWFRQIDFPSSYGHLEIYDDGPDYEIYDLQNLEIAPTSAADFTKRASYNYKNTMLGMDDIEGEKGVEIYGMELTTGIVGE